MKNIKIFQLKIIIFTAFQNRCLLHRRVIVMVKKTTKKHNKNIKKNSKTNLYFEIIHMLQSFDGQKKCQLMLGVSQIDCINYIL